MILLIVFFSFVTCLMLAHQLLMYYSAKNHSIFRIIRYIGSTEEETETKPGNSRKELKTGLELITRQIGNLKFLDSYKINIQMQLTRANLLLKAEEFIAICLALVVIAGLLFYIMGGSILYALTGGVIGWFIPLIMLKEKIKKRRKLLNEQLGDALALISNSLKAGYGFFQAVDIVSKEMTGPVSEEFTILQKEINLGITTEQALTNMSNRTDSDDVELVVTAVLIQRQVGGSLSEVLDNISSTIRERVKIKGEIKTVTAQGRASGLIISLLPVALGVILYLINPDNIMPLFTDPMGIAVLIFSIFMQLIGIFFISRIVKIEV